MKITESGAHMKFIDGQLIMDAGLENAVQISLFTKPGWWGNAIIKNSNRKIGSEYQKIRVTDIKTINDVRDAAEKALAWMKDVGLASKIDISVINPFTNHIYTTIKIYPPGQDAQELIFISNGINWLYQAGNPANERMRDVL